jgi:hypothetical protein
MNSRIEASSSDLWKGFANRAPQRLFTSMNWSQKRRSPALANIVFLNKEFTTGPSNRHPDRSAPGKDPSRGSRC